MKIELNIENIEESIGKTFYIDQKMKDGKYLNLLIRPRKIKTEMSFKMAELANKRWEKISKKKRKALLNKQFKRI